MDGSGGPPFTTSYKQPSFSFQKSRLKLHCAIAVMWRYRLRADSSPNLLAKSSIMHKALYQRAGISTGLPRRGVPPQLPTLASIHVSWTPSSPEASKPLGSTLIPYRVPRAYQEMMSTTTG